MIKELEVRELKLYSRASPANLNLRPYIQQQSKWSLYKHVTTRNNKHRPYRQMLGARHWCKVMSEDTVGITANLTARIPCEGVQIPKIENTVLAAFNSENKTDQPAHSIHRSANLFLEK